MNNKEFYDTNWVKLESMKRYGPMSRHVQRLAKKICQNISFSSLIDVGCGPGVFMDIIQKKFKNLRLAGTDISTAATELARKKFPDADFFETDISKNTIHGSYDLVTMIDVAEHIEDDEAAFVNIKHFCKKYLLIITLEGHMRSFEPEIGHVRNYKKGELQDKLIRSGYSIVKSLNWGWPMYSPLYRDMSKTINAHNKPLTKFRRIMAHLAYIALTFNIPQKGDLIIVLASPTRKT